MHRPRMHPSCHVLEPGIEGSSSSLTSALDRRGARVLRTGLASRLGRMASCEFASRERAMNPEQVAPLDVHLLCRLDTRPPGPSSCSIFLQRVRSPRSPPLSLSLYIYVYLFSSFYYHFSGQLQKLATLGPEDLCPSFPFSFSPSSSFSSSRFLLPRPPLQRYLSPNNSPASTSYLRIYAIFNATWTVLDNLLC